MADNSETEENVNFLNEIHIIQQGYSYTDSEQRYRATGSITLVRTAKRIILVDTGSPRDKDKLLLSVQKLGVSLKDVDHVICTHGHVDHVGNLNLFPKAVHIVGNDICEKDDIYMENSLGNGTPLVLEPYQVDIVPTVGHTTEDISVVVYNTKFGTVVIAGDLFESENDDEDWKDVSQCVDRQEKNREKIKEFADWIVPGHGAMFKVKNKSDTC